MTAVGTAIDEFLAQRRIAVAGVSREPAGHGANIVYKRLRDRGYEVFAVNPEADVVEGDSCYRDLRSIPGGVDAVVIGTPAEATLSVARECRELGITKVWMHHGFGKSSASVEAHEFCRANGIASIAGGCPLMYGSTSDGGHRIMRWIMGLMGRLPREA